MSYLSGRIHKIVGETLLAFDEQAGIDHFRRTPRVTFSGTLAVPVLNDPEFEDASPALFAIVWEDDRHYAEQIA